MTLTLVLEMVVFVPHMNIIHEICNESASGHGMRGSWTKWNQYTHQPTPYFVVFYNNIHSENIIYKMFSPQELWEILATKTNPLWLLPEEFIS